MINDATFFTENSFSPTQTQQSLMMKEMREETTCSLSSLKEPRSIAQKSQIDIPSTTAKRTMSFTSDTTSGGPSAAHLIHIAIERLASQVPDVSSMVDLEALLESLENEHIYYTWQLGQISSAQYKMMGVPIGLVSSIRHCLAEQQRKRHTNNMDDWTSINDGGDDPLSVPPSPSKDIPLRRPLRQDSMSVYEYMDQDNEEEGNPRLLYGGDTPLQQPLRRDSVSVYESGEMESHSEVLRLPSMNSSNEDTAYRYKHWPPRQPVRMPTREPSSLLLRRRSTMSSISLFSGISLDDPSLFGEDNNKDNSESPTSIPHPMMFCKTDEGDLMISDYLKMVLEGHIDATIPAEAKRLEQIRWFLMNGVSIQNRRYRLKQYKSCFVASELVDFMVQTGLADTRSDAVWLGQAIQYHFQWYKHVVDEDKHLSDAYLFFRFQNHPKDTNKDTTDHPPTLSRLSEELHPLTEDTTHSSY